MAAPTKRDVTKALILARRMERAIGTLLLALDDLLYVLEPLDARETRLKPSKRRPTRKRGET